MGGGGGAISPPDPSFTSGPMGSPEPNPDPNPTIIHYALQMDPEKNIGRSIIYKNISNF